MKLTMRQQQILDYILDCKARDGLPPTRAEIVRHFGFRSPNAAQCHLRALADHGAIRLVAGRARGIVPVMDGSAASPSRAAALTGLPLIGRVTAGSPVLAVENREDDLNIDPGFFHPRPDYALRVEGDSMIGAGIHPGDLLLVHRSPSADDGQIVVARIGDEVTVKRLRKSGKAIFLDAENPAYQPITVDGEEEFAIEGLGVGVVRPGLD